VPLISFFQIKVKCHFKDTRVVLIEEGIKFDDLQRRVQEKFEATKLRVTSFSSFAERPERSL